MMDLSSPRGVSLASDVIVCTSGCVFINSHNADAIINMCNHVLICLQNGFATSDEDLLSSSCRFIARFIKIRPEFVPLVSIGHAFDCIRPFSRDSFSALMSVALECLHVLDQLNTSDYTYVENFKRTCRRCFESIVMNMMKELVATSSRDDLKEHAITTIHKILYASTKSRCHVVDFIICLLSNSDSSSNRNLNLIQFFKYCKARKLGLELFARKALSLLE